MSLKKDKNTKEEKNKYEFMQEIGIPEREKDTRNEDEQKSSK